MGLHHPLIRERVNYYINKNLEKDPHQIIIVDVPLLFEGDMVEMMDVTVLVYVNEDTQLQRLVERDKLSVEQAMSRIQAQMPIEKKRQLADIVIDNSGSIAKTEEQVDAIWNEWHQSDNE